MLEFLIDQQNISNEKICVLSYSDEKLGSWSQAKTLGSNVLIPTKIKNLEELKIILDDISTKYEKILIDTPGVNIDENYLNYHFKMDTFLSCYTNIASKIAFQKIC